MSETSDELHDPTPGACPWCGRPIDGSVEHDHPHDEPVVETGVDFDALPRVEQGSTFGAEWWIAMRHLRSKKQEAFLSVVTVLAIVGVMIGVATVNIVVAVMAGFEEELRDKILGANAHMVVLRHGGALPDPERLLAQIEAIDGVEAAAPFVYHELMLRSPSGATGIIVKGVDPDRTWKVTSLREDLVLGLDGPLETAPQREAAFAALGERVPDPTDPAADGLPGIVVGSELAESLGLRPGGRVQLIDPLGGGTGPWGVPTPRMRQFRVAGVFESGMYEYDNKWTYVSNADAQAFLGLGEAVTAIEVRVHDPDRVERVAAAIDETVGFPYWTRHWKEMNRALFEALRLEKVVTGLLLFLIVAVAALLIVTTLIMTVLTKGREIAILKAMGAGSSSIRRIFVIEGSVIGVVGTALGTILGLVGCWVIELHGWTFDAEVYLLTELPVVVEPSTVVVIGLAALATCFLATLYPASRAASLHPVEGLRYE